MPSVCETCGKPVEPGAPSGLCPACLMRTAIEHGESRVATSALPKLRYFGDYELLEEFARGGMGVVYRARQVSLDRTVAVKMMRPGVLASAGEIRRFQAEARMAAAMQHPNIVAIHEVGEFEGLHYFSMDFVEGASLAELVRRNPLAPDEAVRYVQALAEAVDYAHRKGVLHRDLKPSNVLVDSSGRPHITDFGLARPLEGHASTADGGVIGTPAYMPPEQAAGEGAALTAAADCYSLGAILYELLTGRPPFQAPSPVAIIRMVLEEEPVPPRTLAPNIDPALEAICLRCLRKDPSQRYQSAAELADALKARLKGSSFPAPQARRPWWQWAAAAGLLACLGLVSVLATLAVNRREPRTAATPPRAAAAASVQAAPAVPLTPAPAPAPPGPGHPAATAKTTRAAAVPRPDPSTGLDVTPARGSGGRQAFTFRYSNPAAAVAEFVDTSGRACRVFFNPDSDTVGLQVNPVAGEGLRITGRPGVGRLENSVCDIDLSGVVYTRGDSFQVQVPVTFKPEFSGRLRIASWPMDAETGRRFASRIQGEWSAM